jgi:hypothetical protein
MSHQDAFDAVFRAVARGGGGFVQVATCGIGSTVTNRRSAFRVTSSKRTWTGDFAA